ncbi:MAG: DUF3822 family protein [Muribaculaceae bacterium]|nr:DUF3822 family protein [Muribaculaceae bacterium]
MNCDNKIQKEAIAKHPDKWILAMSIDDVSISYTLHTLLEDDSLLSERIEIESSGESYLTRIENAFYDNPILVNNYARVSVVFNTSNFVVVPHDVVKNNIGEDCFRQLFPTFEGELLVSLGISAGADIVFGLQEGIKAFIERTYDKVSISHSLTVLTDYFYRRNRLGNVSKMNVTIIANKLYICVFNRNGLVFSNLFDFRQIEDAAFFILNIWKEKGLDALNDELHISGETTYRQALIDILRQYLAFVMPAVFPSSLLKVGRKAMNVSFDLMLLSLCE